MKSKVQNSNAHADINILLFKKIFVINIKTHKKSHSLLWLHLNSFPVFSSLKYSDSSPHFNLDKFILNYYMFILFLCLCFCFCIDAKERTARSFSVSGVFNFTSLLLSSENGMLYVGARESLFALSLSDISAAKLQRKVRVSVQAAVNCNTT